MWTLGAMFFSDDIPLNIVISKNMSKRMIKNIENLEKGSSLNVKSAFFEFENNLLKKLSIGTPELR